MKNSERQHTERFFYRLLYTPSIFAGVDKMAEALGRVGCGAVATALAWSYSRTHPAIVETVRRNLALLCPQTATTQRARQVFEEFAKGMADYFAFGQLPLRELGSMCVERGGLEHLRAAQREGRGCILATGHFGFFEFGAALLQEIGIPCSVLTWAEPSEELTQWRAAYRARWGAETIEVGRDVFSSMQVVRALQEGRFCAMLVDRPFGGPTVSVPAPGGSVAFAVSPGLLAHLSGAPILPVVVNRRADGDYRLLAKAPVRIRHELPRAEAVRLAARETGQSLLEEFVRFPEQWYQFSPLAQ